MYRMKDTPSSDLLSLVSKRAGLLRCLREGVGEKRELEETLELSRSTLNRGLNQLEANRLIVERPNGYEVTVAGDAVLQVYANLWEPIADATPCLALLPTDVSFDPKILNSATVVKADYSNPDRPVDRLDGLLVDCNRVRWTSPVSTARCLRLLNSRIVERDVSAEFLFHDDHYDRLWRTHEETMRTTSNADNCQLRRVRDKPPASIVIVDESRVWIGVHDAEGSLKGAIVATSDAAVDWGRRVFRRHRTRGDSEDYEPVVE